MNAKKIIYVTKLIILMLIAKLYPALANQTSIQSSEGWKIQVGAVTIAATPAWTGNNTQVAAVPYFSAQYGSWSFGVENLVEYKLAVAKDINLSWGLKPRTDGFDPEFSFFNTWSENDIFDGYKSPDAEFLTYSKFKWLWLSVELAYDISDNSAASSADISLALPVYDNNRGMKVTLTFSANIFSKRYVNYYYGITPEQANLEVGRTEYVVDDDAVKASVDIQMIYPFNRQWSIMGNIKYTQLDNLIVNSPLIEDDNEQQAIVALIYSF